MSMLVRNHRELPYGNYGSSRVIREDEFDLNDVLAAEQILCGKNATRNWTNNRIRELKGQTGKFPVLKEKLICLQNNRKKGLLNGSMWEVDSIKKTYATSIVMDVKSLDEGMSTKPANVFVYETDFTGGQDTRDWKDKKKFDSFTFGYCITVHKSQGSQWDNVLLFDESQVFREERYRHLYTAITRAADRITIVS